MKTIIISIVSLLTMSNFGIAQEVKKKLPVNPKLVSSSKTLKDLASLEKGINKYSDLTVLTIKKNNQYHIQL